MKPKIIEKILLVLILAANFSSSFLIPHYTDSSQGKHTINSDIDLFGDVKTVEVADDNNIEIDENITSDSLGWVNRNLKVFKNSFFFSKNTTEIFLGLNLPPPELLS